MRVVVTGGCGFLGSHLVDSLLKKGHEVHVLDNFATGRSENVSQHKDNPSFKLIPCDIRDFKSLSKHFKNFDWVFHLAALADIVPSVAKPLDYYSTNVTGTSHVLEASRDNGVKRFVYAASSSSYGLADELPTTELAEIRCEYPYALSKYLGELTVMHWAKVYQMPSVALKFFNLYGPRARTTGTYGAVFGVFLAQKMNGQPYTIVGDGSQTRDFTYVSDAVDALVLAAESDVSGEVLNVGSGGTYSINHLVELLGGDKVYVPKRPGEPNCTFADIAKIKSLLGWSPKVDFETGVKKILEYASDWKEAPVWTKSSVEEATADWFRFLNRNDEPNSESVENKLEMKS